MNQIKAFLRCIAVAMEQEKDKIWVKKTILQPIGKSLNEFYNRKCGTEG
ncbi:MAG TPA: hypothetical protein VF985_00925 [Mariniflexile sp.]